MLTLFEKELEEIFSDNRFCKHCSAMTKIKRNNDALPIRLDNEFCSICNHSYLYSREDRIVVLEGDETIITTYYNGKTIVTRRTHDQSLHDKSSI